MFTSCGFVEVFRLSLHRLRGEWRLNSLVSFRVQPFGGSAFINSTRCYTAEISRFRALLDLNFGNLILRTPFLKVDSAFSKSTVSGSRSALY